MRHPLRSVWISAAVLLSAVLLFGLGSIVAKDEGSDGVLKAAKAELRSWLGDLPLNELHLYGFQSPAEFTRAQVGTPLEIVSLSPEALREASSKPHPFSVATYSTGEWYVPITVDGQYRALLSVGWIDGAWRVFGLSAAPLARDLDKVGREVEKSLKAVEASKLLRIYPAQADLLYLTTEQGAFLVPLKSAQQALHVAKDEWLTPASAIQLLQAAVDAALANDQLP